MPIWMWRARSRKERRTSRLAGTAQRRLPRPFSAMWSLVCKYVCMWVCVWVRGVGEVIVEEEEIGEEQERGGRRERSEN